MKRRRTDLSLQECGLYAAASPAYLAMRLSTAKHKITEEELRTLAQDLGNFRLFSIADAGGKERNIQWPKPRLQRIHARIHNLLSRVAVPKYMHSATRGRSYISNAAAHEPSAPTIKIDVKKFFPSVNQATIFNFFVGPLRCRRDVAGLLADILTFEGRLPTGSTASPIIAYYAYKPMFDEIARLAENYGLTMTCYVDDLTLSGARANKRALFEIRKIIARHGLKSHKARTLGAKQPKIITGVCNTEKGARVPNKLHLKIKNNFESLATARTANEKSKILGPLLGRLGAAGQIDPKFRARAKILKESFLK